MAAAQANFEEGLLSEAKRSAILQARREVLDGEHDEEFLIDVFQGGAGTFSNMNMNEVLDNRASEILGGAKGEGRLVHSNDDKSKSQSTNVAYALPCAWRSFRRAPRCGMRSQLLPQL